mmetsp:Transcript_13323/g.26752  ORF Transcript_13323/g.26752 Transcript_13323/m.26752 type:complete len:935 (-) Transcript_13323:2303-5107(-)
MALLHLLARCSLENAKGPVRRQLQNSSKTSSLRCCHGLRINYSGRKDIHSLSSKGVQRCHSLYGDRVPGAYSLEVTEAQLYLVRTSALALDSTLPFSSIDILRSVSGHRFFSSKSTRGTENLSTSTTAGNDVSKFDALSNESKGDKSEGEKNASSSKSTSSLAKSSGSDKKEDSVMKKATDATLSAIKSIISMLAKTPGVLWFYITHPKEFRYKLIELKEAAVKEAHHYWVGSKLLAADIRTARHILGRTLRGSTLSRRERKQLLRTVTDVFRLVPMSIFVLVPFMEFALPFALKIFPNMLPSTFQDSLKEEEKMKRELQMRISMAGFFQDTLAELAKEQKKFAELRKRDADDSSDAETIETEKEASAASFLEFLKKARTGEAIPPNVIIKFSKYFEDNLTLDNMSRMQLINMCKYMGIPPYGNDNLLRFQLRHRIRLLKDDDQRILWEGIDSLTKMELREACRERGMRSTGLSKDGYRKALQQWLDLSVQKNVPISLLIMSRTFYLHDEMVSDDSGGDDGIKRVSGLADAMSGIDKEVLNEIVLEMASSEERQKNTDVMKIQLEVLEHQNELIKEEQEERDAAAKEKEKELSKVDEDALEEAVAEEPHRVSDARDMVGLTEAVQPDSKKLESTRDVSSVVSNSRDDITNDEESKDDDDHAELSTEEIDAISQLTSPDPVHREREELQRIKAAIRGDDESKEDSVLDDAKEGDTRDGIELSQEAEDASLEMASAISPGDPIYTDEAKDEAVRSIRELEEEIEKEAKKVTIISIHGGTEAKVLVEADTRGDENEVGDKKLQKTIDRLKSKVESMVGKIESQLSDVEVKIGNKFHLLDKDMDGVLTMEEMAQVLQTVLKRELTFEEAMAIAADMDQNKDGVFDLTEFAQWAESNTIVKLAEDGREKDLDEMITKRVEDLKERKKMNAEKGETELTL